jgi:hypothetical protein
MTGLTTVQNHCWRGHQYLCTAYTLNKHRLVQKKGYSFYLWNTHILYLKKTKNSLILTVLKNRLKPDTFACQN